MTVRLKSGQRTWSGSRDSEGYREYQIQWLVETDTRLDGPARVLQCPGLPRPGTFWLFDNDVDIWAWCRPDAKIKLHEEKEGEGGYWWTVDQTFSSKPLPRDKQRCQTTEIQDPLLEPQKVSGSYVKDKEEAIYDRFGRAILTSSHEQIRGPQVEFPTGRDTIRIEQNVLNLELEVFGPMRDTLNDAPLWGLPSRCISLSNATWQEKFYGTCTKYYTRIFEFETNVKRDAYGNITSKWDRDLLDEGTKVLKGHWSTSTGAWVVDNIGGSPADPLNPAHFIRFQDRQGNVARVILNGAGLPADIQIGTGTGTSTSAAGNVHVERYDESNFLLLGIPTTL